VFGACVAATSPLILAAWLEKQLGKGEGVFVGVSQFLALIPGYAGVALRAAYYYASFEKCSWEIHVGFGSVFTHRGASLGRNVSMGAYCVIGHADLGDDVMLASRISIPSGKRQHIDESGRLTSVPRYDRVAIGRGSWIGEGAIVMANVGEDCIVSAGAVIVREMPAASLLAGNPASVIRQLKRDADISSAR
jgi:acetyltransferase-like isoleucine patch superfamily enzyme